VAARGGDAPKSRSSGASNRTSSALNGLHDGSTSCRNGLAYLANNSEREARGAHKRAYKPSSQGSDTSTGNRGQPFEPVDKTPSRTTQHCKRAQDRSQNRAGDGCQAVAESANQTDQKAACSSEGKNNTAPSSLSGPTDRSGHATQRHCDPAPSTSDGDRTGASYTTAARQYPTYNAADTTDELPDRGGDRPSCAAQRETETTSESSDRASNRSAQLTEASSNGQQWALSADPNRPHC
jgi:hypothetical protein